MTDRKYTYIITSERAYRRNDEIDNELMSDHEYKVGQVIELDGLNWTVTVVIRNIPVNPKLSVKGCWKMVNSVDSLVKARIAEQWLKQNEVIENLEYNDLMMALSYLTRELYRAERQWA